MNEIKGVQSLRDCVLFSDLSEEQFALLTKHLKNKTLEANQFLFKRGDAASHFFFLLSGKVRIFVSAADGNEKTIDVIYPNHSFAEAIILNQQATYPVACETLESSSVFLIPTSIYLPILKASPESMLAVMAKLSQRLHGLVAEIDRLTLHSGTYRVVYYLLDQIRQAGWQPNAQNTQNFVLETPKNVIASHLAIQPETLSRIFKKLSEEGLISIRNKIISISDTTALQVWIDLG